MHTMVHTQMDTHRNAHVCMQAHNACMKFKEKRKENPRMLRKCQRSTMCFHAQG